VKSRLWLAFGAWVATSAVAAPLPDALKGAFKGKSVVLVSIDTLRADRLGAYGYPRPTSPAIDALARESVVFEQCFSHSPKTAESHMSLFTGVLPSAHGVMNWTWDGKALASRPEGLPTLASLFKDAGYRTVAYTAGGNISGSLGFDFGFDVYSESAGPTSLTMARLALDDLLRSREPFFLFVHTYAVHDPYVPGAEYARLFTDPAYAGRILSDAERLHADAASTATKGVAWTQLHEAYWKRVDGKNPRDVRHVSDLYDAAIRKMDADLAPLIDGVRNAVGDKALFALVSDHGEEFQEHGGFTHNTVFQELLHVPLLLRLPGTAPQRVPAVVRQSDLMPTLLALTGLRVPEHIQSASLLPYLAGMETRSRAVVAEWLQSDRAALRVGDLKYVRGAHEALYDLASDPGEKQNLLPAAKDRAYPVRLGLNRFSEASFSLRARFGTGRAPKLDAETRQQLQALGYIGP